MKKKLVDRVCLECCVPSKDTTRFQMCSLYFTEKAVISTDGRILLSVPYPSDPVEEFPAPKAELPEDDKVEACIIPMESVARVLQALPKKQSRPILENALLHGINGKATFTTNNLDIEQNIETSCVDGRYPPYERAFPEQKEGFSLILGIAQLEALCKALKKAGAGGIEMHLNLDQCNPGGVYAQGIRFKPSGPAADDRCSLSRSGIEGVIMPRVRD